MTPGLRHNRDFHVFWLGQALSVLGGSVSLLALPFLVLDATGSLVQMGLLTVIGGATAIGTGTVAGYVVDRVDRRRLMIVCDLVRAALLCALPLVWWTAGPRIWLLYVLTALVTFLRTLFDVAYVAAVPQLVRAEDLTAANARLMGTFAIGTLLGPVVAGFLTAGLGPDRALAVDGATFLVSAVSLRWVTFDRRRTAPASTSQPQLRTEKFRFREVFLPGFRFLWSHALLRPLTVLLTLLTFVTMGATDLLIFRIRQDLGHDAATLGYVLAVSGTGVVVAAATAGALRRRIGFGPCWLLSVVLIGAGIAVTGVSWSLPVIAALAAVFMYGITLGGVSSMTLRQEVTPDHLLGRVTAAFWTVHNASGPVGAAVLTVLAARHGVPAVSVAAAAFCLLILTAGLLTPLRARSPARPRPASESPAPVSRPTGRSDRRGS